MANITVDFNKTIGKIKPMHGVGQGPFIGCDFSMFHYLKQAGIPFSRLHDVGGVYGLNMFADIPNIFRDFDADPYDENSYDFAFTDLLINALVENGVEPFFRLGVTIENYAQIRALRIYPPAENKKWAIICEHIIRHYTQGWANGFYHNIRYWEIWNEPDNFEDIYENQMWRGTKEQFYALYGVASKHLKKCFPQLMIGGYASCGFYSITDSYMKTAKSSPRLDYFIEFFDGFLDYIKENDCPLDFFSWHSYDGIDNNKKYAAYARKRLDEAGYTKTETSCNEWNYKIELKGTNEHGAIVGAMLLAFQDMPLDNAMFYDAGIGMSSYASLFNPITKEPYPAYYAFTAFNELYKMGKQTHLTCDTDGLYSVAATNGNEKRIVIANTTESDLPLELCADISITKCLLTANGENEKEISLPKILPKHSILTVFEN